MDPRFQTSFIPKKPIVSTPGRAASPINLFSLLTTIIFIVAVALSGGVFFYKQLTAKQIAQSKADFERAKSAFEPDIVNQIVRLDTRIETGKKLLSSHLAVTPLFEYLSTITLKNVRFKDFNFVYLAKDKIQVSMKGQAQSYASVALQSDLLNAQKNLKNTLIGDLALETSGLVAFTVSTVIDPTIFMYEKTLDGSTPGNGTTTPQP